MEFVSESEAITTFLLLPVLSFALFLIMSFLEIFDRHTEIFLISKKHEYKNTILIMPAIIAVIIFVFLTVLFFYIVPFLHSLPVVQPEPSTKNPESLITLLRNLFR